LINSTIFPTDLILLDLAGLGPTSLIEVLLFYTNALFPECGENHKINYHIINKYNCMVIFLANSFHIRSYYRYMAFRSKEQGHGLPLLSHPRGTVPAISIFPLLSSLSQCFSYCYSLTYNFPSCLLFLHLSTLPTS